MRIRARRLRRLLIVLIGAFLALGVVPTALATPPVMETSSLSGAVDDIGLCNFPVQHANGETLVGEPYTTSVERYFDDGVVVGRKLTGLGERVLPGGGVFLIVGQAGEFGFVVDHGTDGDVSGFCSALS
jgi:hypothetical protein